MLIALIQGRNYRDIETLSPKILMINVKTEDGEEIREHCWVKITDELKQFIPRTNLSEIEIKFNAKVYTYIDKRGNKKVSLSKLKDIKIVSKSRKSVKPKKVDANSKKRANKSKSVRNVLKLLNTLN